MKTLKVLKFTGFGLLGLGAISLFVFITMHLWNLLIPELFHGPLVTFWQTAGLIVLSKIIFSGFGHGSSRHGDRRHENNCEGHHHPGRADWWKKFHKVEKGNNSASTI